MSLKQSSKEPANSRSPVPACWGREPDRDCLRIETGGGETFILPYQHFVTAHLQQQDEGQMLSITFSSHQIILEGRHFEEIVAALQEFEVDWITPTPARYQSLREGDEATVVRLAIKAVE